MAVYPPETSLLLPHPSHGILGSIWTGAAAAVKKCESANSRLASSDQRIHLFEEGMKKDEEQKKIRVGYHYGYFDYFLVVYSLFVFVEFEIQ